MGAPDETCPPGMRANVVCMFSADFCACAPVVVCATVVVDFLPLFPSLFAQLLVLQRRARRTMPTRLTCVELVKNSFGRGPAWGMMPMI